MARWGWRAGVSAFLALAVGASLARAADRQGDDDRNVDFQQTVDLARRLETRGVPFRELVLPDEIHGFLRHQSWLRADIATVDFLTRELGPPGQ